MLMVILTLNVIVTINVMESHHHILMVILTLNVMVTINVMASHQLSNTPVRMNVTATINVTTTC